MELRRLMAAKESLEAEVATTRLQRLRARMAGANRARTNPDMTVTEIIAVFR
jgi:hypothetical protein